MAAQIVHLKQRLHSSEEENARLHEELTEQAAVVQPLQEENAMLLEEIQPLREDNQRLGQFEEPTSNMAYRSWAPEA